MYTAKLASVARPKSGLAPGKLADGWSSCGLVGPSVWGSADSLGSGNSCISSRSTTCPPQLARLSAKGAMVAVTTLKGGSVGKATPAGDATVTEGEWVARSAGGTPWRLAARPAPAADKREAVSEE